MGFSLEKWFAQCTPLLAHLQGIQCCLKWLHGVNDAADSETLSLWSALVPGLGHSKKQAEPARALSMNYEFVLCAAAAEKFFTQRFLVLFVFFSGFAMPPWLLSPPPLSLWLVLFCGATRIMCKMFLAMFGSSFATLPVPVVVPVVPVVLVVVVVDRAGKLIFVQVDFWCCFVVTNCAQFRNNFEVVFVHVTRI